MELFYFHVRKKKDHLIGKESKILVSSHKKKIFKKLLKTKL
jgi:hypothetical protein